jgi:uncharacterized heparinase superfamily protein
MRTVRRLARMGLGEVAVRARHEAGLLLERAGIRRVPAWPLEDVGPGRPPRELLTDAEARAIFPGAADPQTAFAVARRFAEEANAAVREAQRLASGRFDRLRGRGLYFGDPIDWHLDPMSGRRSPLMHWSRMQGLDPIPGGDPKLVWELNRHQWMIRLGQAWRLTGDEVHAQALASAVTGWLEANPPGWGINWASSLEAALRLIAWTHAFCLARGARALTWEWTARLAASMASHAGHIERNLSTYFSPNTHLTGEALGLYHAGLALPRLPRAAHWKELGERILCEQLERQVLADGVYFEQSTGYQRYTAETYMMLLLLKRAQEEPDPPGMAERVQAMLDFLLSVRAPDGTLPPIGDGDGGRLLPLSAAPPEDARPMFALAAVMFDRGDYAWAAGGASPEIAWLLGAAALDRFDALRAQPPAFSPSRLYAEGGYAVMASGWEEDAHRMIVDVGPIGCPLTSGHGHADALSVQCWAFGRPLLVDPGTYCYTTERCWRDHFRSAAAHSTVLVDGRGAAVPDGPFSWSALPVVHRRQWRSDDTMDLVDASHDGFRTLKDPVTHRRRVAFIKPSYWVIVDDLEGAASHDMELRLQLAPGCRVRTIPPRWHAVSGPGSRGGLMVGVFATVPLSPETHEGELVPPQGWCSPAFGRRVPAPMLVWSSIARLPARVATVLIPVPDVSLPPPPVSALMSEGPRLAGLVFGDGEEFVMVNEQDILLERRHR